MMIAILSIEEVDAKLAMIARQMREQFNDFNHNLSMGHDSLMVCADRKLERLKDEWDETLLLHGITCVNKDCEKTSPISQWKFFCKKDQKRLIETFKVQCSRCGSVVVMSGHPMSSRIIWIINHAYALPEDFLPNITNDINVFHSKTSIPR